MILTMRKPLVDIERTELRKSLRAPISGDLAK